MQLHSRHGSGRDQRGPVVRELDDMRQRRKVAELHVFVAGDVVGGTHCGEHFCLLDGVDAEVGFEIEVQVQHVFRIASLLGDNLEDLPLYWVLLYRFIRIG